jgi:hypothetical protein
LKQLVVLLDGIRFFLILGLGAWVRADYLICRVVFRHWAQAIIFVKFFLVEERPRFNWKLVGDVRRDRECLRWAIFNFEFL